MNMSTSTRVVIFTVCAAAVLLMAGQGVAVAEEPSISLTVKNGEPGQVLAMVSKLTGANFIMMDDSGRSEGSLNISVRDVPVSFLLSYVCLAAGLSYEYVGNCYVIRPAATGDQVGNLGLGEEIRTFSLNYVRADEMMGRLEPLVSKGKMFAGLNREAYKTGAIKSITDLDEGMGSDSEGNYLTVVAPQFQMQKIEEFIAQNDRKPRQVTVEVRLLAVDRGKTDNLGVKVTTLPVGTFDKGGKTNLRFAGVISEPGINQIFVNGKILANPTISLVNGKTGVVQLIDTVPVFEATTNNGVTQYTPNDYDVGVVLRLHPRIGDNNDIYMDIQSGVSIITGYEEAPDKTRAPRTSKRFVDSAVHVRSGETIVIAGLVKDDDIRTCL
ncbi:MAG: hypothetical protein N3A57_06975, partial [Negativicutes bacterium]|nr:hypothetical protein [Negativicutes bacterium]